MDNAYQKTYDNMEINDLKESEEPNTIISESKSEDTKTINSASTEKSKMDLQSEAEDSKEIIGANIGESKEITGTNTEQSNEIIGTNTEETKKTVIKNENSKDTVENDNTNTEPTQPTDEDTEIQSQLATNNNANQLRTKIIVNNVSVVKERNLVLNLLDSKNNTLANKKVTVRLANKTYTNTTDKNGKISLKISLDPGKYTVNVKFAGEGEYAKTNRTFNMNVYKIKTHFAIPRTSIIRGYHFYAYLRDQNNKPLAHRSVIIKFRNDTYIKKTDNKGRFRLLINSKAGNYETRLIYRGASSYSGTSEKFVMKSYRSNTKITFTSTKVIRNKALQINLKYNQKIALANKKLIIVFNNKKYERTTNKDGRVNLKITKPVGTYKIKVTFEGTKGFKNSTRSAKIKILPNYTAKFIAKNKTMHRNANKFARYYIKLTDLKGNGIGGETVTIRVKCNNFTAGTGRKITKKTIVLSSDNIANKKIDRKRLNDMARLLRAKGYKVIVSGIGPNYHVSDVKNYKNVCVFSLVGGIDSGMFVDMASSYYQNYLKYNNNQFVLGCVDPPKNVDLATRRWLVRAHDDDYSPKSFTGLYFPGKYLNKKTKVDYVYGSTPRDLVNNFLKYAKKGKSIGFNNTLPGQYETFRLKTNRNGYVYLDLPIGNHTIKCSFINRNKGTASDKLTTWVNVIK